MTNDEFKNVMGNYITEIMITCKTSEINKNIRSIFAKKFAEIEHPSNKIVLTVEIRPEIEQLFMDAFTGDHFMPIFDRVTNEEVRSLKIIGNLWGATVKIVDNLPYLAIFIGENNTISFLGNKLPKLKLIKLSSCRFRYLEF